MTKSASRAVRISVVVGFYGLIGVLALHSLWLKPGTVGDTLPHDYYHVHWGYWWIRYALLNGLTVYQTDFVHFPYTANLAFHSLSPFWYPLWAVLEPFVGTLAAVNAIMSAAIALAGLATYSLLRHLDVRRVWALAGGVMFALTPANLLSAMLTNVNYLGVFWLPFTLLVWGRAAASLDERQGSLRRALGWGVVTGLTFYGLLMTEYQLAIFVSVLLLPYGVYTLAMSRRRLLVMFCGVAAIALSLGLLWLAGPLPYLVRLEPGSFAPQPIEDAAGIPFPKGLLSRLDPYARQLSVGWLIVPLVLAAAWLKWVRGRALQKQHGCLWVPLFFLRGGTAPTRNKPIAQPRSRIAAPDSVWLLGLVTAAVLALGPRMEVGGQQIWLPYVALHELFGGMFRVPARFAPVIVLAALLFALPTLSRFRVVKSKNGRRLFRISLLLLVMIDGSLLTPMPVRPAIEPYAFHTMLREERGDEYRDYIVVDVPVAGGSGEAWVGEFTAMETQFFGTVHEKRMVNGTFARVPLNHFWYWLYDDPMLAWLGQRRWLEADRVEAQLRQRVFEWPIGYIVVRQDEIGRDGPTNQEIIGYLNQMSDLVCPLLVERDAVLYRASWHPAGCPPRRPASLDGSSYRIDMGTAGDELYLGWGWHRQESISGITLRWAGEYPQADLYVDLAPGAYRVVLHAQAFAEARQLQLMVGGQVTNGVQEITPVGLAEYEFSIPSAIVGEGGLTKLSLLYDAVRTAQEMNISEDSRRLSVAVDWVRIVKVT